MGWMIDRDGKPLTDPKRADEGLLVPIGEYKGYGLSLIIGLLAGTLNRAAFGRDIVRFHQGARQGRQYRSCHCRAVDRGVCAGRESSSAQVDVAVRTMRGAERLPGVERIWLPGEQSHLKRHDRGEERRAHAQAAARSTRRRRARSRH